MLSDCFGSFLLAHVAVENKIRIIELLKKRPYNINQLADALGVDYKLVQHYIGVLERNNMVTKAGEKYAVLYFISN